MRWRERTMIAWPLFLMSYLAWQGTAEGIVVSGAVSDTSGQKVAGALVAVTDESDPSCTFRDFTDEEGIYELSWDVTAVAEFPDADDLGRFRLFQNWPNPFNPSTRMGYILEERGNVELVIFNILGQKVRVVEQGVREPGAHYVSWDGCNSSGRPCAAGVYIYRLKAGNRIAAKKMVMLDGAVRPSRAGGITPERLSAAAKRDSESPGSLYTIEVTAPGIRGHRAEHVQLSDGEVYDVVVERLSEEEQDVAITETGSSGGVTVFAGESGVSVQLMNEQGKLTEKLAGVQATVQHVGGEA